MRDHFNHLWLHFKKLRKHIPELIDVLRFVKNRELAVFPKRRRPVQLDRVVMLDGDSVFRLDLDRRRGESFSEISPLLGLFLFCGVFRRSQVIDQIAGAFFLLILHLDQV